MKKSDTGAFPKSADLTDLLPEIALEGVSTDELYIKAFFGADESVASEYAQNTTTWD